MRNLNVYYCPACGRYGYYQLTHNAVCHDCHEIMNLLPMSYQSFMNLEFDMRDVLISSQISGDLTPHSSVVQRITELEKVCDPQSIIHQLEGEIEELQFQIRTLNIQNAELLLENQEQENTIGWMHDLIWDMTKRLKEK
ncbi:MAG: teichuronopeptide [Clostridium sp.]